MALTDTAIGTAKPHDKLYLLADAQGLCPEVTTAGGKLWRLRYRFECKVEMLGLSVYHAVTLAQARERGDTARKLLVHSIHPSAHKQQKAAAVAQALSIETLAREWYDYNQPRWAPATASKARSTWSQTFSRSLVSGPLPRSRDVLPILPVTSATYEFVRLVGYINGAAYHERRR